jgi:hypothetical protein
LSFSASFRFQRQFSASQFRKLNQLNFILKWYLCIEMPPEKMQIFYAKQPVHCSWCPPCDNQDCLQNEKMQKKCPAATQRCDLPRHTKNVHDPRVKAKAVDKNVPRPVSALWASAARAQEVPHPRPQSATTLLEPGGETSSSTYMDVDEFADAEESELDLNSDDDSTLGAVGFAASKSRDPLSHHGLKCVNFETKLNLKIHIYSGLVDGQLAILTLPTC